MKNKLLSLITIFTLLLASCGGNDSDLPLDKPYWTPEDYNIVYYEIRNDEKYEENLPSYDDPETSVIIEKLVDENNYKTILTDDQLGLNYKEEMSEEYFNTWRELMSMYRARDVQDKYIYEKEMLDLYHFGLGLQLEYFRLGNQDILSDADDPDSENIKNLIESNNNTLINNSLNYLDFLNEESVFSEEALSSISNKIKNHYPKLLEQTKGNNTYNLEKKLSLLYKKVKSNEVKESLKEILKIIEDSKPKKEVEGSTTTP